MSVVVAAACCAVGETTAGAGWAGSVVGVDLRVEVEVGERTARAEAAECLRRSSAGWRSRTQRCGMGCWQALPVVVVVVAVGIAIAHGC